MRNEDFFLAMNGIDDGIIVDTFKYSKGNHKIVCFQKRLSFAACICIILLATATVTAVAAIHHFWGRGLSGIYRASDEQQQTLTEQGQAIVFSESDDYSKYSVMDNGITISPVAIIADDNQINVALKISGVSLNQGESPNINVDAVEVTDYAGENFSYSLGFYDGIIEDDNGNYLYDDGTPVEEGSNGNWIHRYVDADGNLECQIDCYGTSSSDGGISLAGKTLLIELSDFYTVNDTFEEKSLGGRWTLELPIPKVSNAREVSLDEKVSVFDCEVSSVKLSPISAEVRYNVEESILKEWLNHKDSPVPYISGITMDDGTTIKTNYLGLGYWIEVENNLAISDIEFNRIIEPEKVKSIELMDINGNITTVNLK